MVVLGENDIVQGVCSETLYVGMGIGIGWGLPPAIQIVSYRWVFRLAPECALGHPFCVKRYGHQDQISLKCKQSCVPVSECDNFHKHWVPAATSQWKSLVKGLHFLICLSILPAMYLSGPQYH